MQEAEPEKAYLKGGTLMRKSPITRISSPIHEDYLPVASRYGEVKTDITFSVGVEMKGTPNPGSEYDIVLREGDEIVILKSFRRRIRRCPCLATPSS